MEIFLSHETALSYWRAVRDNTPRPASSRSSLPANSTPTQRDMNTARSTLTKLGINASQLSIIVPDSSCRRILPQISCRVWSYPLPPRAFAKVASGLHASSPEFTFLQMAKTLSHIELVRLGFELCGSYSLAPNTPEGFASREPLTTCENLRAFIEKQPSAPGAAKALRATKHVIDGSASPAETALAMFLALPTNEGGFGLPKPAMNLEVQINGEGERTRVRRCDLLWPEANLAIEYDSDAAHALSRKIHSDSVRRNELTIEGLTVITVTKRQLYNLIELRKVVDQISPLLIKRSRVRTKDYAAKQHRLYGLLLAS